ncbi:MAG: hypothetical protein FWG74_05575 [Planctomycetes bacterium]|nr:hypothetical protein [Planctomycetota bacterium]
MRSKLGTKSRLAAHLTALFLLIVTLVYYAVPPLPPHSRAPTVVEAEDKPPEPASSGPILPETPAVAAVSEPETAEEPPPAAASVVPAWQDPESVSEPREAASVDIPAQPDAAAFAIPIPAEYPPNMSNDAQPFVPKLGEDVSPAAAESVTGAFGNTAALSPLGRANLEVLGDGVYWLSPGHDLRDEITVVPELKTLVILAPAASRQAEEFGQIRTEILIADLDDLSEDVVEHFLHLTFAGEMPVLVAPLPEARSAAFFKGLYLMIRRDIEASEAIRKIEAELEDAGSARDEIVHRLLRLDLSALK